MTVKNNLTKKIEEVLSKMSIEEKQNYTNSLGKVFPQTDSWSNLRKISYPEGEGKTAIRRQMRGWFDANKEEKEGKKNIITQEEVDKAVESFLSKGGSIEKLEPGKDVIIDNDYNRPETEDEKLERIDPIMKIETILNRKISELRY